MKRHPAEKVNEKMITLQRNLDLFRRRKPSILKLLDSVISKYEWYKSRNKFPPTTKYIGDDGYSIIREPNDKLILARTFEHDIFLAASSIRNPKSNFELSGDPKPIPKSWDEIVELRDLITKYFVGLEAETSEARKNYVIDMIQLYSKSLFIKVDKFGEITPKYVKVKNAEDNFYIIKFEYDYKEKLLMGVSKDGKKIPANNLTRK